MPISAPRPGFTVVCKGVLSSSVTALMTPACSNIDPAVCATAGNEHADNRAKAKTLLMATPGWSRRRATVGGVAVPARSAPDGLDSYHLETMLVTTHPILLGSNASTNLKTHSPTAFK